MKTRRDEPERDRAFADLKKDVERTRRHIVREGFCPVMNDTKWRNLVSAVRSLGDFTPRYRQKHVRSDQPADWDREWFYHLRPYSVVEWVDIDPLDSQTLPPTDHTAEIEQILWDNHVPFSREGPYLRVWGYTRCGSPPSWA